MEQYVKDRKKEPSKELSGVLSGVAVRDDEWIRILDDWLEIYEHHEGKLLRKRQKSQAAQKNKKDDRQYRDDMAYRMGLKKKEKLNSHNNLAKSSEILNDSESLDAEAIQETQVKNMQTERNFPFEIAPSSLCLRTHGLHLKA